MKNLRHFLSKQSINHLFRFKPTKPPYQFISSSYNASTVISTPASPSSTTNGGGAGHSSTRQFHSTAQLKSASLTANLESAVHDEAEEGDDTMNEFLSRFVYIMRGKLTAAYPDSDKQTVNAMLLVIVEKVVAEMEKGTLGSMLGEAMSNAGISQDFSDDLWRTVWEVSNKVCEDMDKQRKKEQMKKFLQSEEVKKMARFASEAGIRGDMLRELKFKWAREQMEESEFYESLQELKNEEQVSGEQQNADSTAAEKGKFVGLPKRKGKIKYKIYGLDLSDPKWKEAADKIHEAGEVMWPKEAKAITGKCKLVTEKILSVEEEDDLSPLLAEWAELLQPSRVDWESLLQRLQLHSVRLYYKAAEHVLDEPSFETNIRDFSKLIDAYAKEGRMEDAERILAKMDESGIQRDIPTLTILVHMYTKAGDIDRAKQAFETLRNQGFRPDMQVYSAMIMAHAKAGEPRYGESLQRDMEARDIKPTEEIYLALLRAYAKLGDYSAAQRISTAMQFSNIQPTAESCTLLLEAGGLGNSGEVTQRINTARFNFDNMIKLGIKPDDKSVAIMVATYKRRNLLDKALDLLIQLENEGFEPGISTYTALLDWLAELQLVDEAEQVLDKISRLGETPPLKIHVILCDMYSRARVEKKALQALGVLEAKKDQLTQSDFERVIKGLQEGKFTQDAQRMLESMEALGFAESVPSRVFMMATPK